MNTETGISDETIAELVADAAILEAANLVATGVSTVEQVDLAVTHALRWRRGPFRLAVENLDSTLERLTARDDADPAALEVLRGLST